MSQPALAAFAPTPFLRNAFQWWLAQLKHVLPPTVFFFVGFNLILWTKRLILEEHGVEFSGFLTATLAALLVGKAVLVTDNLPFMRRFDGAPIIQPILFKSAIYWLCVFIVRIAEGLVHFLWDGGSLTDFPTYLIGHFSWARFLSIQIWLMVLFMIYVTIHELNTLFGDGELARLFFRWRSSEAKLTRRCSARREWTGRDSMHADTLRADFGREIADGALQRGFCHTHNVVVFNNHLTAVIGHREQGASILHQWLGQTGHSYERPA